MSPELDAALITLAQSMLFPVVLLTIGGFAKMLGLFPTKHDIKISGGVNQESADNIFTTNAARDLGKEAAIENRKAEEFRLKTAQAERDTAQINLDRVRLERTE